MIIAIYKKGIPEVAIVSILGDREEAS